MGASAASDMSVESDASCLVSIYFIVVMTYHCYLAKANRVKLIFKRLLTGQMTKMLGSNSVDSCCVSLDGPCQLFAETKSVAAIATIQNAVLRTKTGRCPLWPPREP